MLFKAYSKMFFTHDYKNLIDSFYTWAHAERGISKIVMIGKYA